MWCVSLPMLINFHVKKLDTSILDCIDFIKPCVGGDHGKSTHSLITIMLLRYKDSSKATFRLELKLGKTNEETDRIDCVKELLTK